MRKYRRGGEGLSNRKFPKQKRLAVPSYPSAFEVGGGGGAPSRVCNWELPRDVTQQLLNWPEIKLYFKEKKSRNGMQTDLPEILMISNLRLAGPVLVSHGQVSHEIEIFDTIGFFCYNYPISN